MSIPKTWTLHKGTTMERKYHLVSIVEDKDEPIVVCKHYSRKARRWNYEAHPQWVVEYNIGS